MSKNEQGHPDSSAESSKASSEAGQGAAETSREALKISCKQCSAELHDLQVDLVKRQALVQSDREIVFELTSDCLSDHRLAR